MNNYKTEKVYNFAILIIYEKQFKRNIIFASFFGLDYPQN